MAFSPDLGGAVPVEPEVAAATTAAALVFADLGARVTDASPDFTGADEVFRTLRAWNFEATFGALEEQSPEAFKATLRDNIAQGRALSGRDLARAEQLHTALFQRVRQFFTHYDILLLPVSQVLPFDVDLEYPTEIDGVPMTDYLDWMASAYLISATGCPALSVPAAFSQGGLPIGVQLVGPHHADFAGAAGRPRLRAGHPGRRPPPAGGLGDRDPAVDGQGLAGDVAGGRRWPGTPRPRRARAGRPSARRRCAASSGSR